ncbi:hypothetical protein [Gimesia maris]|uniref:hypothetical protein n=1 Tax=Gimesia maris TaxID=122 RepID=UPI0012B72E5C|nr:hypothetical protein [Gimesia maris]
MAVPPTQWKTDRKKQERKNQKSVQSMWHTVYRISLSAYDYSYQFTICLIVMSRLGYSNHCKL